MSSRRTVQRTVSRTVHAAVLKDGLPQVGVVALGAAPGRIVHFIINVRIRGAALAETVLAAGQDVGGMDARIGRRRQRHDPCTPCMATGRDGTSHRGRGRRLGILEPHARHGRAKEERKLTRGRGCVRKTDAVCVVSRARPRAACSTFIIAQGNTVQESERHKLRIVTNAFEAQKRLTYYLLVTTLPPFSQDQQQRWTQAP